MDTGSAPLDRLAKPRGRPRASERGFARDQTKAGLPQEALVKLGCCRILTPYAANRHTATPAPR